MTVVRGAAGLAAILTAMLVQAALVGPLVYPVPVSLPLIVVVAVAVLSGPSTGIALGFGAGLLADLTSQHPVGVLALTWLGAGVVAGVVGGVVVGGPAVGTAGMPRRTGPSGRARGRRRPGAAGVGSSPWRAQGMLTGVVAAAATAVSLALSLTLAGDVRALPAALVQLIPAGLIDAMLAVAVLALARAMLASAALRAVTPVRLGVDEPAATLPMQMRAEAR